MEISKRDIAILDLLYQMDRKTLGEDVCENGHHFHKGKYDFCPMCGCKFKAESEGEGMRAQLVIEYINGHKEEIYCDEYSEGVTSLMYYIRFGVNEGEHYIPYSSIKRWSAHRF